MFDYKLVLCKFCGGSSQELQVGDHDQEWTAIIHCGGCELTIMPFYAESTKEDAIRTVVDRWNASPATSGVEGEAGNLALPAATGLPVIKGSN